MLAGPGNDPGFAEQAAEQPDLQWSSGLGAQYVDQMSKTAPGNADQFRGAEVFGGE
jgi:hypothetical protein